MLTKLKKIIRDYRIYFRLRREWLRARKMSLAAKGSRVLIVPCDPWGVVGSRGDQAMVLSAIQHVKEVAPSAGIDILTDSHKTDDALKKIGLNPIAEWNEPFAEWIASSASRYGNVYIVGADVTDGVYGIMAAMKMVMFYDIFSKAGAEVRYLGFSWSESPHRLMKCVLGRLTPGLPLPVRDPISLKRLEIFTAHRPLVQVADVAFMLKPRMTSRAKEIIGWCEEERSRGRTVVALNVHPMFNDVDSREAAWCKTFVRVISSALDSHPEVSLLFVPHDNRPTVSDEKVLSRLFIGLTAEHQSRCRLVKEVMDADEIKAVLGSVDGMIAGRMHISIAAFGQGVPVLGLVYQGKFEGLWDLLKLPVDTMLSPKKFLDNPNDATLRIVGFIESLASYRARVSESLPSVLELSAQNFICAPEVRR